MKPLKIIVAFQGATSQSNCFDHLDYFVPVHGGRAISPHVPRLLLDMYGDDGPDSISWTNPYIGELTCLYWAWKHLKEIGSPVRIGLNRSDLLFPIKELSRELEPMDDKEYILTSTKRLGVPVLVGAEVLYGIGALLQKTLLAITHTKEDKTLLMMFLQQTEYAEKNLFIIPTKELDGYMKVVQEAIAYLCPYFKLSEYSGTDYVKRPARVMEFITAYHLFKLTRLGYSRLVTQYQQQAKGFQ